MIRGVAYLVSIIDEQFDRSFSALCSCLGHQDQEHYVPKIVEAIKRIGPTAIPYLEQERDYKPPETRLKRILELLEAMQ